MTRVRIAAVGAAFAVCLAVATVDAAAARYPAAVRGGFRTNCVATATIALKSRHVTSPGRRAAGYCDCVLVRLEARMSLAAFKGYELNLLGGRAQNPTHVRLVYDSARICAQAALT